MNCNLNYELIKMNRMKSNKTKVLIKKTSIKE